MIRTNNLDFNIDLDEFLGERVDLVETRIHRTSEAAKLGDQANIALGHGLVRVRADDAARDSSECANDGAGSVDHSTVPAVSIFALITLNDAGI